MKKYLTVCISALLLIGCQETTSPSIKERQALKAEQAAASIKFTENAEIDNIKRRLELTSSPSLVGYIILLNGMGQPILYTGVQGKVTSSGKRLTPPVKLWNVDKGEWHGSEVNVAPSDEGTWGSSDPYVFFWDINGQYMQWNGDYLYSDKPFRLQIEPIVIGSLPANEHQ